MGRSKTRERQLRRLAERRSMERARIRHRRIALLVVAGMIGSLGIGTGVLAFFGRGEETPEAAEETTPPPSGVACEGEVPAAAAQEKPEWDEPPGMEIDTERSYEAVVETSCGRIELELFADRTPVTVNNFVFLARSGFFDGLTFHRVVNGFVIQGGDPAGDGTGGPGYSFEDEIVEGLRFNAAGLLAMANSGPDTNGSQFFITLEAAGHLDGLHTIFGRVTEGLDVVREIEAVPVDDVDRPQQTVYIESVTIVEK